MDEQPGLAETDVSASITVTNGLGIIVERSMYRTSHNTPFMAGHDSAGVTAAAAHWFFAEGATGTFFDMFLLLANPGAAEAHVTVRYLLPGGAPPVVKPYTLEPAQPHDDQRRRRGRSAGRCVDRDGGGFGRADCRGAFDVLAGTVGRRLDGSAQLRGRD